MKKTNFPIFIILGIIFFLVISNADLFKKKEGLSVHYYSNGVEVFPNKGLFSIIGGTEYNQISFSVYGTATGTPFSNLQITDASPIQLKNALPTTTQALSSGETRILWNSNLINTSQFEGLTQPVRFSVNISGKNDYTELTEYKNSFIDLTITPSVVPIWCYQEFANVSTSCGGLSTGIYYTKSFSEVSPYSSKNTYDGIWNTPASGYFAEFYANYTKPVGATNSSKWIISDSSGKRQLTIPSSCFQYNSEKVQLRATTPSSSYSNWTCFDGAWKKVYEQSSGNTIYEEAMNWSIT